MEDWLKNHLGTSVVLAIATLGGIAVLFRKLWTPFSNVWQLYRAARKEVQETVEQRVDGYQDLTSIKERQLSEARHECDGLKLEIREIRRVLADQVRATMLRDDINRQERAMTRALKKRLRENSIDFSDIDEAIQKEFLNE